MIGPPADEATRHGVPVICGEGPPVNPLMRRCEMRHTHRAGKREVKAKELGSYSDYSLYEGWQLKGWPVRTMVRGATVMLDERDGDCE